MSTTSLQFLVGNSMVTQGFNHAALVTAEEASLLLADTPEAVALASGTESAVGRA